MVSGPGPIHSFGPSSGIVPAPLPLQNLLSKPVSLRPGVCGVQGAGAWGLPVV